MIGVYVIKCKINDRFYVGVSKDIKARWNEHKSDLKNNKHHSIKLQRSYNKYGAEAFEYLVIYESLDYETAVNLELAMIKAFYGKMLLNSSANSKGFYKGYKHTSESRAKISKALLGNKYTLGYKHTEEAKQKQRNASKGNPTRFKPLSAYIKDGITYLGSIEASIKTNIPRTTLMKHAKLNKNGWSCTRLNSWR
jgi:group I intron endonuclease